MPKQLLAFFLLLTGLLCAHVAASSTLSLHADKDPINLLDVGGRLYLADKSPEAFTGVSTETLTKTLSEVLPDDPGAFADELTPVANIDRFGGAYWLYAKVKNTSTETEWVLDPHGSIIDSVRATIYTDGSRNTLDMGHLSNHDFMLHYGKVFTLSPGEEAEILLYFESRYFSSQARFELTTAKAFRHKVLVENTWIIACIGGVLLLSIYNFFLGAWTRDRNYIYYALYLVFSMAGWSAVFNMWSEWHGIYSLKVVLIPFFPAIAFNILYYINFLDLRQSNPKIAFFSYAMAGVNMVLAFCYELFTPGAYFMVLSTLTGLWVLTGLGVGILRLRQGYKPALFFVAAFAVVFIAANLSVLPNLGLDELIPNADLFTLVAQTIDMLLLALALAHRIRVLRDDRERALQQTVLTEQRASEQEKKAKNILEEANAKLEVALNIAEEESTKKSEFLRLVSHELRTPLQSIASSVDEWDSGVNYEEKKELMGYIRYGAARLRTQVDNLVVLAETDSSELQPGNYVFEFQPVLDKLLAYTESLLVSKEVKINVTTSNLPLGFISDGYLLENMLRTILENACKYTSKGLISFELEWCSEKNRLYVTLQDTGRGMDENQLDRMFQDFVQISSGLNRKSEGLGLGLTVFKRMCQALNAKYEIHSEPGVGTEVKVEVPLKAMAEQYKDGEDASTKGKVLIVEDNPVNAKVLAKMVNYCGYESDIVFSGQEAIDAISEKVYMIIFMDIQMPVMDGITATSIIRKRGIATPIIAVTANSDIMVRSQCMDEGMNDFMVKPVRKADVHRTLERQLPFAIQG